MRRHLTACLCGTILAALTHAPIARAADTDVTGATQQELHDALLPGAVTRGLRVPPPPSSGHKAAAYTPRVKEGHAAVDMRVEFRTGSAALTASAMRLLDALGGALTSPDLARSHFRIEGHTDSVGTPEANLALSDKRAQAVAAYLEGKFGVEAARLEPVGRGQSEPLVPTPPQTPEPRNRRVEVVNLGA